MADDEHPRKPDMDRAEGEPFLDDKTVVAIMGDDEGRAGDREPRRPLPPLDSGTIALPVPDE